MPKTRIMDFNVAPDCNLSLEKLAPSGTIGAGEGGKIVLSPDGVKMMKGTVDLLSVISGGTVSHGKSQNEQDVTAEAGVIFISANGHRQKMTVSDTGQVVITDLGL